jgi:serine/threonine-protein kinase HipA
MKNTLSIRLHGQPVGILEQKLDGKKIFTYAPSATLPISLSMPIRETPYQDLACEAFFGGLLPEGDAVRRIIGKKYNISPYNTFALLKAIGHDCAGAISCHEIEDPINSHQAVPIEGNVVTDNELYKHIKELPKIPCFLMLRGYGYYWQEHKKKQPFV